MYGIPEINLWKKRENKFIISKTVNKSGRNQAFILPFPSNEIIKEPDNMRRNMPLLKHFN
jgi:hypothetical protein